MVARLLEITGTDRVFPVAQDAPAQIPSQAHGSANEADSSDRRAGQRFEGRRR
ncbi:hypothetical protein [Streptomyces sp. WAC00263]|uniref:hypothetical protein n=1 Tax=Streptomyces sp. WAC00263 TaxID=1917422 RepID=UPI001F50BDD5|nr:hypothetical protein [Streptomyces sp. WAC00263]